MSRRFPASSALLLAGGLWMGGFLAGAGTVRAHDIWLEPDALFAAAGQEIAVTMHVGEKFHSEEQKPLRRADVVRFRLLTTRHPPQDLLVGLKDSQLTPAAKLRSEGGNALLAMERGPKRLDQDAEHFTRYLTEEGAAAALASRAQSGRADQPGRERYTRYIKALVQDQTPSSAPAVLYRRRLGQRLEILLENNPGRLPAGKVLSVKVLFEKQPLAGVKVTAFHRDRPDQDATRTLTATTNAAGRASFPVDQSGAWLVRTVHIRAIVPVAPRTGSPATAAPPGEEPQWESFWAAYVFGVRLTPAPAPPATPPGNRPHSDEHPPTATTAREHPGDSLMDEALVAPGMPPPYLSARPS